MYLVFFWTDITYIDFTDYKLLERTDQIFLAFDSIIPNKYFLSLYGSEFVVLKDFSWISTKHISSHQSEVTYDRQK